MALTSTTCVLEALRAHFWRHLPTRVAKLFLIFLMILFALYSFPFASVKIIFFLQQELVKHALHFSFIYMFILLCFTCVFAGYEE